MRLREKKGKKCKNCDNEIRNRNLYCNNICQKEFETKSKLSDWINGKNFTRRGGNSIPVWIRKFLLEESNYSCSLCGWNEINSLTGRSPLDIDHIDGDAYNNSKKNLRVLCPNCHSLQPTFKNSGNRKSTRKNRPSSHSG